MINRAFLRAGHTPTLLAAFFYFDMSFMVWVLLGPLGVQIGQSLHLNAGQKGFMVAVPVLAGALLRPVNGVLVDRIGPKRTGIIGQVIVMLALFLAWFLGVHSYAQILVLGVMLGVAGASFAVALPLASRWYPPEYQGVALGIAGAGNSGTVFAALFAPGLAVLLGWNAVLGLAVIPLAVAFAVYLGCAKDAPSPARTEKLCRISRRVAARRCLVVHVFLRRDVWRLLRPGLVADHLLQCGIRAEPGHRRLLHRRPACSPAR